ncbi:VirK/YbjX family protein [Aeromonas rivipollensis]|uniref:VirK/YbjX family protein n=1 Tax=Aeromonas rivipollensis TaxID=948519 RepID=UPI00259EA1DD|nr:VirK/YbjX family protein [Aeromonas rivipollensis]MDM5093790.1 VirK/YbjX family protein [Aeromonas rivipollensis]
MARFLYPDDSARKTFNRGKFVLRSLLYRPQLNRVFELFQTEPLRALPAHYPELLDKPMRPYRFACSTVNQRVRMVEDHYRLLLARYPDLIDPLYLGEGIELGRYPEGGCRLVLRHDGTFRREAELALSIVNEQGERLYSCAFSLAGSGERLTLMIGSMQGPEPAVENAQDRVRELTKEGHGLRPKSLLVQLVLQLAQIMGAAEVLAVRKRAHVFQAKRYSSKQKANLQADYDELWQEFDARDVDANFVALQAQPRKPLEEIASKKRAMYRRRYEWLDLLVQEMTEQFARQ